MGVSQLETLNILQFFLQYFRMRGTMLGKSAGAWIYNLQF